jgi:predicted ATP-dependent serine protease
MLDTCYGICLNQKDVNDNIVGRIKLSDTSTTGYSMVDKSESDLAVAVALISRIVAIPVWEVTMFVREIVLVGELSRVPLIKKHIAEANQPYFLCIIIPKQHYKKNSQETSIRIHTPCNGEVIECNNALDALNEGLVSKIFSKRPKA